MGCYQSELCISLLFQSRGSDVVLGTPWSAMDCRGRQGSRGGRNQSHWTGILTSGYVTVTLLCCYWFQLSRALSNILVIVTPLVTETLHYYWSYVGWIGIRLFGAASNVVLLVGTLRVQSRRLRRWRVGRHLNVLRLNHRLTSIHLPAVLTIVFILLMVIVSTENALTHSMFN